MTKEGLMPKGKKKDKELPANEEVNATWMRIETSDSGRTEVMEIDGGMLIRSIYTGFSETSQPTMAMVFVPKKGKKK